MLHPPLPDGVLSSISGLFIEKEYPPESAGSEVDLVLVSMMFFHDDKKIVKKIEKDETARHVTVFRSYRYDKLLFL